MVTAEKIIRTAALLRGVVAMNRPLGGAIACLVTAPLYMDERSKVGSHVVKSVVDVLVPRFEPLGARGELALGHIRTRHGFQQDCSESPDHNLEVHQRFGELQAQEG
jgi:hypothetical protein